jgi:outer membrane receptor for ferrienterochelin and colicins
MLTALHCLAPLLVSPALAQDRTPPPGEPLPPQPEQVLPPTEIAPPPLDTEVGTRRLFLPADFARYAPRTAMDMVRQVPGFQIRSAVEGRGLGQAQENIVVNGQRVADKSGGAAAELERMPASRVVRIELTDASDLGIPGLTGLIANVITAKVKAASGRFSWEPQLPMKDVGGKIFRGNASYSSKAGPIDYTVAVEDTQMPNGSGGITLLRDAEGALIETREESGAVANDQPRVSAQFVLDGPGTSVGNANVSYRFKDDITTEVSHRIAANGTVTDRSVVSLGQGRVLELGGDFSFDFVGGRLKLIGLYELDNDPFVSTATSISPGLAKTGDEIRRHRRASELIGRAEYDLRLGQNDFQLSAEAAYNTLDSEADRYVFDASGALVPVPFPGASGTVGEDRYEVMASWGMPLGESLSLQLTGGAEHSTIEAGGISRSFFRPKGSATLTWRADAQMAVTLRAERTVGQLAFADFLATVNLTDQNASSANAELRPPVTTGASIDINRKLGPWGSTTFVGYFRSVDDVIDYIPVGPKAEARGNIDRATRYGFEWKSTLLFDELGLPGLRTDVRFLLEHSHLTDPLTGEQRSISGNFQQILDTTVRYDIPATPWALGLNFINRVQSPTYRLSELSYRRDGPVFVDAYVEHKNVFGLTVRASLFNVTDAPTRLYRFLSARRTDGIQLIERRDRDSGRRVSFSVRGTF